MLIYCNRVAFSNNNYTNIVSEAKINGYVAHCSIFGYSIDGHKWLKKLMLGIPLINKMIEDTKVIRGNKHSLHCIDFYDIIWSKMFMVFFKYSPGIQLLKLLLWKHFCTIQVCRLKNSLDMLKVITMRTPCTSNIF